MAPPPADASLADVAAYLAAPGRGILASDESTGTIGKRLEKVGLQNDEVRELLNESGCVQRCCVAPA
jgi:fructose-bisphosphate aldolase class 1